MSLHRPEELEGWRCSERVLQELSHGVLVETSELERAQAGTSELTQRLGERVVRVELHAAIGTEKEHRAPGQRSSEELEQKKSWWVGPVKIVEHHQHRCLAGNVLDESARSIEKAKPRRFRSVTVEVSGIETHQHGKVGHVASAELLAECLDPRPERRCSLGLVRLAPSDDKAFLLGNRGELLGHTGLADAGLADEHRSGSRAG